MECYKHPEKIATLKQHIEAVETSYTDLETLFKETMNEIERTNHVRSTLFVALTFVALIVTTIIVSYLSVFPMLPDRLNKNSVSLNNIPDPPNRIYDNKNSLLATPSLDLGVKQLTLRKAKANFTGYAPGAQWVHLLVNNREIANAPVTASGFLFEDILLEPGTNVIQVRSADSKGNELYSMAGIVQRLNRVKAKILTGFAVNRMQGPRDKPHIALTFDAGSTNKRAEKVLNVLREKGIITTIFVTGKFIKNYPETVKNIVAEGHEVGNHTYSHLHLTTYDDNMRHHTAPGVTREILQEELLTTKNLFEKLTGKSMAPWWRAPYGEHNQQIREWAGLVGFKHVDWTRSPQNFDILDWVIDENSKNYRDAETMLKTLTSLDGGQLGRANGGIVLMHLGTERHKDFPDEILPMAIDIIRDQGYKFVTISSMFS